MGHRNTNRRGLVLDGARSLPIRPDLGVLLTPRAQQANSTYPRIDRAAWPAPFPLDITVSTADMAPRGDASELPFLAAAGELRSEARKLGAMRKRSAACLLRDGSFLVATALDDNNKAIAEALLACNCRQIVALNRGRQVNAFVHLAGTDHPPQAHYKNTVLYGMAVVGPGTARGLDDPPHIAAPIEVPEEPTPP